MDTNLIERLTDGIFSKALQVRRMIQRGATDLIHLPLAEVVALSQRVEGLLTPQQLAEGVETIGRQRWHKSTVEMNVRDGYAQWAKQYDGDSNLLIALEEPVVLELIGDVSGLDVLDAACGTGRYALLLAEAGARVAAIDSSAEMLQHARRKAAERGSAIDFREGDLTALPYPDEAFDLVVCALSLCHLTDLNPAAREFARVLRPGGRVIVSDFHPFCLLIGWRTAFYTEHATCWVENHLNLTEEYVRALLANGFELTDLRESVVDERVAGILTEQDIERFRGWPAALVLAARKERTR